MSFFDTLATMPDARVASLEMLLFLTIAFLLGYCFHALLNHKTPTETRSPQRTYARPVPKKHPQKTQRVARDITTPKKTTRPAAPDDLKRINGVGPKIEKLLHAKSIKTFQDVIDAPHGVLQDILTEAGPRFRMHDPKTWKSQAQKLRQSI